jgi:hypothetical protein
MDENPELLNAILEIRDLLRLVAEPAIAERDKRLRVELKRIVGKGPAKQNAVLLMDGIRTQSDIQRQAKVNQGNLSTLVKQLKECKLLDGDGKKPKLSISIPTTFFESEDAE